MRPCGRSPASFRPVLDFPPNHEHASPAPLAVQRHRADRPALRAGGALSRVCALHHHAPGAAGRARRPQARASPVAVCDAAAQARSGVGLQEVRPRRRRCDRQVPSARRSVRVRRDGAPRPGLRPALPADRGPGQLRQHRRRQRRRLPLHRGPPHRRGDGAARRHPRGHRRLPRDVQWRGRGAGGSAGRLPEPARQRRVRHRGRHGHLDPAAQRGRAVRGGAAPHQAPGRHDRKTRAVRAGSGFSHRRRRRRRARGDHPGLRDRTRRVPRARPLGAGRPWARNLADRRHRDPLSGAEGPPDRTDRRTAHRQEAAAGRRHPR